MSESEQRGNMPESAVWTILENREPTYCAKVLHHTKHILNDTLRAALARQEAIYGAPMKISNIRLAPLADDPREVYEVFVEFEPAAPAAM